MGPRGSSPALRSDPEMASCKAVGVSTGSAHLCCHAACFSAMMAVGSETTSPGESDSTGTGGSCLTRRCRMPGFFSHCSLAQHSRARRGEAIPRVCAQAA
eukprot:3860001-Pyramimonas_sp.AAC.1